MSNLEKKIDEYKHLTDYKSVESEIVIRKTFEEIDYNENMKMKVLDLEHQNEFLLRKINEAEHKNNLIENIKVPLTYKEKLEIIRNRKTK